MRPIEIVEYVCIGFFAALLWLALLALAAAAIEILT